MHYTKPLLQDNYYPKKSQVQSSSSRPTAHCPVHRVNFFVLFVKHSVYTLQPQLVCYQNLIECQIIEISVLPLVEIYNLHALNYSCVTFPYIMHIRASVLGMYNSKDSPEIRVFAFRRSPGSKILGIPREACGQDSAYHSGSSSLVSLGSYLPSSTLPRTL